MARTVIGVFDDWAAAEHVVDELLRSGYRHEEVSILSNREGAPKIGPIESTGSGTDAGTGAAIGTMAGFIAGIAALAIPGIGPVLAAGPLASGIVGATVGAATGGVVGALAHHGVSEEHAEVYSESVRRGSTLVAVHTDDMRADEAVAVMNRNGAIDIDERVEAWRREGWTGRAPGRKLDLGTAEPGHIEHVPATQVGKSRADAGGAKVFTW